MWDFTCADTLAPSYVENSAKKAVNAVKNGEDRKIKHYDHLLNEFDFIPVSVETFGTWGEIGLEFVKEVGKLLEDKTQEKGLHVSFSKLLVSLFKEKTRWPLLV